MTKSILLVSAGLTLATTAHAKPNARRAQSKQPVRYTSERVLVERAPWNNGCPAGLDETYYDRLEGWNCARFEWRLHYQR